jgi:hypothetical protein
VRIFKETIMSAHDHDQDSNTGANIVIGVALVGLALLAYMLAVWLF